MCVGRFKSFGYGRSRCLKITECKNDQHISGISGTPTLINKAEFVVIFKAGVRIGTTPATLFQEEDQLVAVLKNWMMNSTCFDPSGMHTVATRRTEMRDRMRFKSDQFACALNQNIRYEKIGIFKVE